MKRLVAILLLSVFLVSCSSNTVVNNDCFYTFSDSTGYKVVLNKKPKKVAILFSSYAEIWTLAGGEVAITVQESIDRGFCDEDVILVDDKSGHTSINAEILVTSKPDLIIGTADHEVQVSTVGICRDAGIPSALFKVEDLDDYLNLLEICCNITENTDRYSLYGTDIEEKINALISDIPKKQTNILFIRAGSAERSTKAKTADDNFVCRMLKELGTYNIAENAPVLLDSLSLEEILKEQPEQIFITTMGDENAAKEYMSSLLASEGWNELTAEVTYLPKDMFHYKPNARWYEAYSYLYEILYG